MPALRKSFPLIAALALMASLSHTAQADSRPAGIGGQVRGETSPVAAAQIYAYQLADLSLHKVLTDAQGNFLLQDLPAGLYKVIAHKAGFMPVVVMLTRTTAQAYTFLELKLSQRKPETEKDAEDFWTVRAQVPADVLRDIEISELQLATFTPGAAGSLANFKALEMQALTGVDRGGQVSGGGVGIKGQLGQTQVDLKGNFRQLSLNPVQSASSALGTGQSSSVSLDLDRGHGSRINFSSVNNRGIGNREDGPVDLEHYQLNWSQGVGENGRTDVVAHYTNESNYHHQGAIEPVDIPGYSRSLFLEGAYTESFSDSSTLQAGLRYRERRYGFGDDPSRQGKASERQALSSIDLFGRGGVRLQPAVLMEYGLYSTLSDGSLALTPQGGLVLQLGSDWQLETTAARRVYTDSVANPDFLPTLFEQRDLCEQGSEACYQVNLTSKGEGDDSSFTLGAVHRKVGDTLRLYFSDDFFDRLESLYLVRGDSLPEVHVGMQHKLAPRVVTKFESSLASGGGGTFFAADGRPYENDVRYLVASLDTRFLASSTGVFIAFHQLQQQLDSAESGHPAAQMEYERLQLMVNQNLNVLLNLASEWTVQLNMELSRGGNFTATPRESDQIRRSILGGIAVKF